MPGQLYAGNGIPTGIPGQARASAEPALALHRDHPQNALRLQSVSRAGRCSTDRTDDAAAYDSAGQNWDIKPARNSEKPVSAQHENPEGQRESDQNGDKEMRDGDSSSLGAESVRLTLQDSGIVGVRHGGLVEGEEAKYVGPLERWHAALSAQIAAELKGRASELSSARESRKRQLAETESQRSDLWMQLSRRIYRATCGEREIFRAGDVELVRWFRLVQLRQLEKSSVLRSQRCRSLDALFGALYAALIPVERARVNAELAP
jgi:hypothetical protein